MPKVAILLPVFNGELYLSKAIESALGQTFGDFELLIADDVSQDSSAAIIDKYACREPRIKAWRNATNNGLFGNYNECLKRTSAPYIKPFAQDDFMKPEMLSKMVSYFDADAKLALASCSRSYVDEKGEETKVVREYEESANLEYGKVLQDNLLTLCNKIGEPTAVMFRKEYAGNGFDQTFYHLGDIEYWLRIVEQGKYLYIDEVLCSFRQHTGSTTNKNAKGLLFALDMIRLGDRYKNYLQEMGLSREDYSRLVAQATASHLKYLCRHQGMSLTDFLEQETTESHKSDSKSDAAIFKELLFYALLIASETLEENYALKEEWQAERNYLEDNLDKLLNSRSWKLTVPLREAVKVLRANSSSTT